MDPGAVPVKLVMVVRTDLDMGRGKIAAQVAHAAVAAVLAAQGTAEFVAWLRQGQPKIVLRVSGERALRAVCDAATAAGLPVEVVADAGRTQVPVGTVTCCAIGPAAEAALAAVVGALPLL